LLLGFFIELKLCHFTRLILPAMTLQGVREEVEGDEKEGGM